MFSGSAYVHAQPLRDGEKYCLHHLNIIRCAATKQNGARCCVTSYHPHAHAQPLHDGKKYCLHHQQLDSTAEPAAAEPAAVEPAAEPTTAEPAAEPAASGHNAEQLGDIAPFAAESLLEEGLTVHELRSRLLGYGLSTTGIKAELRARLEDAMLHFRAQHKTWDVEKMVWV